MLSPQEEAEYQYLRSKYASQPEPQTYAPSMSLAGRAARQVANLPGNIFEGLMASGTGFANMGVPAHLQAQAAQVPDFFNIPAPQTTGEKAVDVTAGIAQMLGEFAIPAGAVGKLGKVAGMGRWAPVAGDISAGLMQGAKTSPEEMAGTGAEFGALAATRFLPVVPRIAANIGIPIAGQMIRGQDPTSMESLVSTGAQTLFGSIGPKAGVPWREVPTPEVPTPPSSLLPVLRESMSPEPSVRYGTMPGYEPPPELIRTRTVPRAEEPLFLNPAERLGLPEPESIQTGYTPPEARNPIFTALPEMAEDTSRVYNQVFGGRKIPSIDEQAETLLKSYRSLHDGDEETILAKVRQDLDRDLEMVSDEALRPVYETARAKVTDPREAELEDIIRRTREENERAAEAARIERQNLEELANRPQKSVVPLNQYQPVGNLSVENVGRPQEPLFKVRDETGRTLGAGRTKEEAMNAAETLAGKPLFGSPLLKDEPKGMKKGGREGGFTSVETNPLMSPTALGGATGALFGATQGETPEERIQNAAIFGLAGAGAGLAARKALGIGRGSQAPKEVKTRVEPAPENKLPEVEEAVKKGASPGNPIGEWFGQRTARISEYLDEAGAKQMRGEKTLAGTFIRSLENLGDFRVPDSLKAKVGQSRAHFNAWVHGVQDQFDRIGKVSASVTDQERQVVREWLRGDRTDLEGVNEVYVKAAQDLRSMVSDMQASMLKGEADPRKRALLEQTMGKWTTRAFDVFDNPDFQLNPESTSKFVASLKKNSPEFKDWDEALLTNHVKEHVENLRRRKAWVAAGEQDRISQAVFKHRKDLTPQEWEEVKGVVDMMPADLQPRLKEAVDSRIMTPELQEEIGKIAGDNKVLREVSAKEILTPEYRELLGEINDPVHLLGLSATKIAKSAATGKLIDDILSLSNNGMKMVMTPQEINAALANADEATRKQILNRYVEAPDVKVSEKEGKASLGKIATSFVKDAEGKLHGQRNWMDRSVADQLDAFDQSFERANNSVWHAMSKLNGQMKQNLTSRNPAGQARNWMTVPVFLTQAGVYGKGSVEAVREAMSAFRGNDPLKERLMRLGVTGVDFGSEIKETMRSNVRATTESTKELLSSLGKGNPKAALKLLQKADRFAQRMYAVPDNFVRATTFLHHEKAFKAMGMGAQEAEQAALDVTRRWTMDYANVPRIVKIGRQVPFLNPFLTFQAEQVRITKNLIQDAALMARGLDNLSPAERYRATRAVPQLAAVIAYPALISAGFEQVMLDESERKEWQKAKKLMPEYLRGQYLAPLGYSKGTFEFVGLRPYTISDVSNMIKLAAQGEPERIFTDSGFFGLRSQPAIAAMMDVAQGERFVGREPLDTPGRIAGRIIDPLLPAPLQGYNRARASESFSPNTGGGLGITHTRSGRENNPALFLLNQAGVNVGQTRPQTLLSNLAIEKSEKEKAAKRRANQTLKTNASEQTKAEARKALFEEIKQIRNEYKERVR